METVQPVLKRGRDVWDKINMPEVEFRKRVDKITIRMNEENIDVLIAYGHGQNDYGNPCYITNYLLKTLRGAIALVTAKGEVTLFVRIAARDIEAAKLTTWVEDARSCGDVAKECVSYLKENNLIPATIGFAGLNQFLPNYQLEYVNTALEQCKIVNADHILGDLRMIKSRRECDQVRRASRIVSHAFSAISEFDAANENEMVLEAYIDREARLEGAEDVRILFAKPKDKEWFFRPAENEIISTGETVIVYLAIELERYWSEGIRTFQLSDGSFLEIQPEHVAKAYEKVLADITTGKSLSDLYKEMIAQLDGSNIDYISEYGFGQGIGLSLSEPPMISADDNHILQEGMVLGLRLAIRDKEAGAVMVGNTLQVKADGPEILSQ